MAKVTSTQGNNLLSSMHAEFSRVEDLQQRSNVAQFFILFITLISIFSQTTNSTYALAVLNFVIVILWQYFAYNSRKSHSAGERMRRMSMLINGLGAQFSDATIRDVISAKTATDTVSIEDSYYASDKEQGFERLANLIEESSFWSSHLFRAACTRTWVLVFVPAILLVIALLALNITDDKLPSLIVPQMICALFTSLVAGGAVIKALSFNEAANSSRIISSQTSRKMSEHEVLLSFADYNATVESAPVIPTSLYEREKNKLNSLWNERS